METMDGYGFDMRATSWSCAAKPATRNLIPRAIGVQESRLLFTRTLCAFDASRAGGTRRTTASCGRWQPTAAAATSRAASVIGLGGTHHVR
jgi:hypothetical protein